MSVIHPIILSGGSGSRLWPLSRSLVPKQLLALTGERSLIQETAARAAGEGFCSPFIVCNVEHRFLIAEQMREAGIQPAAIVLEPEGRNTAPAAAVAALLAAKQDPGALLLLLPADHVIRDIAARREAVSRSRGAAAAAGPSGDIRHHARRPRNGLWLYPQRAPSPPLDGCFAVARFVEKPDAATAAGYVASGDYSWNSGMFLFQAGTFLAELERLEPDLLAQCRAAVESGKQGLDFFRLDATAPSPWRAGSRSTMP